MGHERRADILLALLLIIRQLTTLALDRVSAP